LKRSSPIQLVVVDVDGCLTPGEGRDWNWSALQAIQDVNQQAKRRESLPAVTLCTGRQQPYVEVLMQAIGAYIPGIYENGCGLYIPSNYRFLEHPAITAEHRHALSTARLILQEQVVGSGLGYFQPGKESSLSIYPLPGTSVGQLEQAVASALTECEGLLTLRASVSCVDVTPAGIDKGAGVRWLAQETDIALARMGGIGDSKSDLAFLHLVGHSAAPANAAPEVRAQVEYVSAYTNGEGVVDILKGWLTDTQPTLSHDDLGQEKPPIRREREEQ
jgi:HAD superfamily hydrolase (TIGR01484 family)